MDKNCTGGGGRDFVKIPRAKNEPVSARKYGNNQRPLVLQSL